MKNIYLKAVLVMFGLNLASAQDFQGEAYYTEKMSLGDVQFQSNDMSPDMNEKIKEKMRKAFEKEFVLQFTKTESNYEQIQKLENNANSSSGFQVQTVSSSGDNGGKLYKNLKEKGFLREEDFFDKEFLIADSLKIYNWEFVNEQKTIGNYMCMKAQIVVPVTDEDLKQYEEMKKKQETSKTAFFDIKEPKERIIEAWYTMDVPVSNGPGDFWGLPGLILEIHDGSKTYLCTKIVLNPKEKFEIKRPKKGKKVSQAEFEKISEEKMKSMMDENGVIHISTIKMN